MKSSYARAFVSRWLTILILLAAGQAGSAAWPNWIGPRHDGISAETGWSTEWPEEGLPLVWQQAIGIGFSSVAVAAIGAIRPKAAGATSNCWKSFI